MVFRAVPHLYMAQWDLSNKEIQVSNDVGDMRIETSDWEEKKSPLSIPRPVDDVISGYTSTIRFPFTFVQIMDVDKNRCHKIDKDIDSVELPLGDYIITLENKIRVYIRFNNKATVYKSPNHENLTVSFPSRVPVTIGFCERHEDLGVISVPPTPAGLASAISYSHCAHETTTPDRSYHTLRNHPPLIEFSDTTAIPDSIGSSVYDTGIELCIPDTLESVFTAAPLAYYLQAKLTVDDRNIPLLRIPNANFERELSQHPEFSYDVATLLRQTFFLDCLVRKMPPSRTDLLQALGVDPDQAYNATPAERLTTYLSLPYADIEPHLPEWHLSTYLQATVDNAVCLPFLLDDLSPIYPPRYTELDIGEFIHASLDDFYRSPESIDSVNTVNPDLHTGRFHAWLANGVPINAFKTTKTAYWNRLSHHSKPDQKDRLRITVVLNDPEMRDEQQNVENIYRQYAAELPINISIKKYLTRDELGSIFENPNDFLHYIGHCKSEGLRCTDGYLSVANIDRCNTKAFFLNACGSYYEGVELIEKGSLAGGVTSQDVLNEEGKKVGATFARLLINGFCMEQALQLARRQSIMGKKYTIIGNGTHIPIQCSNNYPEIITLKRNMDGKFKVIYDILSPRMTGEIYRPCHPSDTKSYLHGSKAEFLIDQSQLPELLECVQGPILFNDDLYWPNEIYKQFAFM